MLTDEWIRRGEKKGKEEYIFVLAGHGKDDDPFPFCSFRTQQQCKTPSEIIKPTKVNLSLSLSFTRTSSSADKIKDFLNEFEVDTEDGYKASKYVKQLVDSSLSCFRLPLNLNVFAEKSRQSRTNIVGDRSGRHRLDRSWTGRCHQWELSSLLAVVLSSRAGDVARTERQRCEFSGSSKMNDWSGGSFRFKTKMCWMCTSNIVRWWNNVCITTRMKHAIQWIVIPRS